MTSEINTPFCVKNTITTDISNSFFVTLRRSLRLNLILMQILLTLELYLLNTQIFKYLCR